MKIESKSRQKFIQKSVKAQSKLYLRNAKELKPWLIESEIFTFS